MRYGSVCSGIEAASLAWEPLGWSAAWFAEIEKFPSAVLAHRWPHVPNLGDMCKLPEYLRMGLIEAPDVLVGGTPCQSWSVAGKRGGSSDPRGQLTFKFLEIVKEAQPQFVVWENVPGVISAEGGAALEMFLDAFLDMGYMLNCDILDAQFFGVAQRRRRVFLICQRADFLMKQRTDTSAIIGATVFAEILHDILTDLLTAFGKGRKNTDSLVSVKDGLRRKIRCFETHGAELSNLWLTNLAEAYLNVANEPSHLESNHGHGTETTTPTYSEEVIGLLDSFVRTVSPAPYLSTSQSLKNCLADLFYTANEYTTLTGLSLITPLPIYTFVEALGIIGSYIARLKSSSPLYSKAVSSVSTALQKGISYARQTNSKILSDEGLSGYGACVIRQAEQARDALASARTGFDPAEILFESEGVRRDTAPSREAGETVTGSVAGGAGSGSERTYAYQSLGCYTDSSSSLKATGSELGVGCESLICMSGDPMGVTIHGTDKTASVMSFTDVAGSLRTKPPGSIENSSTTAVLCMAHGQAGGQKWPADIACTLNAHFGDKQGIEDQHINSGAPLFVPHPTHLIAYGFQPRIARNGRGDMGEVVSALNAQSGETGKGDAAPCVAVRTAQTSANGHGISEELAHTLDGGFEGTVAFNWNAQPDQMNFSSDTTPTLTVSQQAAVQRGWSVRRLLPVECELLQGMPRDHTNIPGAADGPRYKSIGNSKAVPVVQWLGRRIARYLS